MTKLSNKRNNPAAIRATWILAAAVGLSSVARADDADTGLTILKCFHPTGDFVRAHLGEEHEDASGRHAIEGRIDFRGGITGKPYYMDFVMHVKKSEGDTYIRVTPGRTRRRYRPAPRVDFATGPGAIEPGGPKSIRLSDHSGVMVDLAC